MQYEALDGADDVHVLILSNDGRSAASIVHPAPTGDEWRYSIAGDLHVPAHNQFPTAHSAMAMGELHLRSLLNLPLDGENVMSDSLGVRYWQPHGPDDFDPTGWPSVHPFWHEVHDAGREARREAVSAQLAMLEDPPGFVARLRDIWKAWRL